MAAISILWLIPAFIVGFMLGFLIGGTAAIRIIEELYHMR